MHETQTQAQQNKEQLERQNAELLGQKETLEKQQAHLIEQQNNRQSPIWRPLLPTPPVRPARRVLFLRRSHRYFDNGQVKVDPKDDARTAALAEKAKTVDGYVIKVKGHAFTSGSASLNQKLSEDRAVM